MLGVRLDEGQSGGAGVTGSGDSPNVLGSDIAGGKYCANEVGAHGMEIKNDIASQRRIKKQVRLISDE